MNNQSVQDKLTRHLNFLQQDEKNISLLIQISELYTELNDLESAQLYLNKANALDREGCLVHQGLLYLNQNLFNQAQECFIEALNYADTPALRYNLGITYFINQELDKAWEVLSPILEGAHYPDAELLMARILHRQDSLEEAISLVEHVLEENEENTEALGLLSLLYFDLNEDELAKQFSTRALELNSENYDARVVSVMLRLITQETSVQEIEELIAINPEDSRLWFALGNLHMTQGNLDEAQNTLQKAVDIYPGFYDCHIALAWCQLLNDEITDAHETYQNAVELVDELADGWGGLALIHALREDYLQAEQLISKANELNPDCFLTELAEAIYFNHKNPQKAKEHLMQALHNSETPVSEKLALLIEEIQNVPSSH